MTNASRFQILLIVLAWLSLVSAIQGSQASPIKVGVGKEDITDYEAGPVSDPLYAKAMVIEVQSQRYVIITLDVVALERIGPLPKNYLAQVRDLLSSKFAIPAQQILINTSHCHGNSSSDVVERTVKAVEHAIGNLELVKIGIGQEKETRISQNRRIRLKNGREADYRHAYSLPDDQEIVGIGPIDPDVTVVKCETTSGNCKAVLYQFACHPILGTPSGGNTADLTGYASKVIEEQLGGDVVAFFLQGCGGDINPVGYKDNSQPRNAETLGNMLGLTVLKAVRNTQTESNENFSWKNKIVKLPLADLQPTIQQIREYSEGLTQKLQGTSLNFKEFYKAYTNQKVFPDFPSADSGTYLHQQQMKDDTRKIFDANSQRNVVAYLGNILLMEEITRVQTNLRLLRMHEAEILDMRSRTIDVEMIGLRLGDLRIVTFPGELTVSVGLEIKAKFPDQFIAVCGYSNGYIYYAPTTEQLANRGFAQEDSDCLLAPQWQAVFNESAMELLR